MSEKPLMPCLDEVCDKLSRDLINQGKLKISLKSYLFHSCEQYRSAVTVRCGEGCEHMVLCLKPVLIKLCF